MAELERARVQLYGARSTTSAQAEFHALGRRLRAERRTAIAAIAPPHGRMPWRPLAVAAALIVLVGAVLRILIGIGGPVGPSQAPKRAVSEVTATATATDPAVTTAQTVRTTQTERSHLDRLFQQVVAQRSDGARFRGQIQNDIDESADNPIPANGGDHAPTIIVPGGSGTGDGTFTPAVGTGQVLTLAIVTDRPIPWSATLVLEGHSPIRIVGTVDAGRYQYAVVPVASRADLRRLELQMPLGVRYSWQLLRRG